MIEDAHISAGRSEASMIYSGINNYCATEDMKYQLDNSYSKICTSSMNPDTVSQMVNLGNAIITSISYDGTKLTNLVVESNSHTFTLCGDGSFAMNDEECDVAPDNPDGPEGNFISTLMQQYNEENTKGLVQDETNPNIYYYKGTNEEVGNNYLWYGGHHWRVIEIDTDANTLLLIGQQPLTAIYPSNSAWTSDDIYDNSYINMWLNDYFYNSLDSSIQNNIVENAFNIGIYTGIDEITTVKKVGLLDEEQYTRAGGTDSFLDIKDFWWLGNLYNSSDIRNVDDNGNIGNHNSANVYGVRAVIKISDITITGGNGTLTSNYEAGNKATNTSDIQVGEYINVPYSGSDNACGADNKCIFRVVSKDSDSIKVVLNGLLSTTSIYGSTSAITTNHTIYTPLNTFVNNISSSYRYTGNKTFYIGDYPNTSGVSQNYIDIQTETLLSITGLPTVGEMFSGNDIDLSYSSTKDFVNGETIENPKISTYYWTMNSSSSSGVRVIYYYGYMGSYALTGTGGIRPVIVINSDVNIISGTGTWSNPYQI